MLVLLQPRPRIPILRLHLAEAVRPLDHISHASQHQELFYLDHLCASIPIRRPSLQAALLHELHGLCETPGRYVVGREWNCLLVERRKGFPVVSIGICDVPCKHGEIAPELEGCLK